jgi:hypothetical protein
MITRQVLYHLSNSSSPVFVKIRSCELFAWAGFKSPSSQVAGITGMCHHAWPLYFLFRQCIWALSILEIGKRGRNGGGKGAHGSYHLATPVPLD